MFRRKEEDEGLFGSTTTANASDAIESATVINSPAPAASASASSYSPAPSQAAPAPRPAQAAPASAFRPSNNTMGNADITRNRLPEAKAPLSGMSHSNQHAASANVDKSNKSGRRVLTVGTDILLKGEIATCDRLVIEGKVDATLNDVHTVEIAETGSFKGSARIEDAEISGLFEGDLVVNGRLVIYASGKVRGKITYGEIEIERGGELTGEIKTTASATASAARPSTPARTNAKQDDKVAA